MCYVKQTNVGQEEMSGFVGNPVTVAMVIVIWIDKYPIFLNVITIWTVLLHLMRLWCLSKVTHVTILRLWQKQKWNGSRHDDNKQWETAMMELGSGETTKS